MYLKQIIKKIIRPPAGTMRYLFAGLMLVAAMLLQINVSAQANCVVTNTVDIATTPPNAMMGENGGDFTILPADVDNGSIGVVDGIALSATGTPMPSITGNCSSFQMTNNQVEVWLFVTNSGTQTSCNTTVTLVDNHAPEILCNMNSVIPLGTKEDGEVTITTNDVATVFENCNLASFDFAPLQTTTFDCMSASNQSLTLVATDATGNSSQATCNFTLEDQTDPVANCVSTFNYFTSNANPGNELLSTDIDDGSTDNCAIASTTLSQSTFTCAQVNTLVDVTLTVTDANGNSSTCISAVSVFDNTPPMIDIDMNATIALDDMGMLTFAPGDVDVATTDNCTMTSNLVWTFDPAMVDCDSLGKTFDLLVTVMDESFNMDSQTIQVTIDDQDAPEAICFMDTTVIALDASGMVTLDVMMVDSASTDICGIFDRTLSQEIFDCTYAGTTVDVTLVVTDGTATSITSNNTDMCITPVRIIDTIPPVVTCKLDTVSAGTTIVPGDVTELIDDNCGIGSTTLSMYTFGCETVGDNLITVTVEDVNGNLTTCMTTVTVVDNVAPTASAKAVTIYLDAAGSATVSPFAANDGSMDVCDNSLTFSVAPMSFDCDDIGLQSATLVVTDDGGNSAQATFDVTVMDTLAPVFTVAPHTMTLDMTSTVRIGGGDFIVSATDNCNISDTLISRLIDGPYVDSLDFTCADLSGNPIDIYVQLVDDCMVPGGGGAMYSGAVIMNNTDTMMTTLTLEADMPPVAMAKDITIALDAAGAATISHLDIDDGSTGLCGNAITISQSEFDCDDLGDVDVSLIVEDAFGNMDTTMATVTVTDTLMPVLTLTPLIDTFNTMGVYTLDVEDIASYTDNCMGATLSADITNFSCEDAGTNQITVTLTDVGGNTVTGTTILTLSDMTPPEFTCVDSITISLEGNGFGLVLSNGVETQTANKSNFGGEGSFLETESNEDTQPIAFPGISNTAAPGDPLLASQIDVLAPSLPANTTISGATMILCNTAQTVNLSTSTVMFEYIHPISGDTLTTSAFTGGCFQQCAIIPINNQDLGAVSGSMLSLLSAELAAGSSPLLNLCPSSNLRVEYRLEYFENDVLFVTAPTDNCTPDLSYTFSNTIFTCYDFDNNTPVVLDIDVMDAAGNMETCAINVGSENLPVAIAADPNNIPIQYLNSDGTLTLSTYQIDAGSTLSCEVPIITLSPSTFDCTNLGTNTVTLRVENANGDFDEATTTVEIAVDPSFPNPCTLCPETLIVDNDPVLNDTYQASDALFSTGNISGASNSNDVIFTAGNKVTLEPGFRSDASATFKVNIQECVDE